MTPEWEHAVRIGAADELERLAAEGANINAKDQHGQTALMVASLEGRDAVVHWLIARGADLPSTVSAR